MKRAIEEYFPIIDINRLAVPERNAFKPIYQMHKWFARRSSSVFRAILLGALKPAGTDIMEEFYKDHTNDPDTKGKVILDPFMGGGTTVVEALRLGCKVIGVDLNPVAWFIVKTEVEPVDIEELKKAYDRLANRVVAWSGNPLKETLLSLYKTECPACGNTDADIIYTFWVKSAPCTTATCKHHTPLFSNYVIVQKKPSIRYIPDFTCTKCSKKFDWEREPAALVGEERLMVNAGKFSAGEGRNSARWVYSSTNNVHCPWCEEDVTIPQTGLPKLERKKVPLSILYCPNCEGVWQYRGELADEVDCPTCRHHYKPNEGNVQDKGKFVCGGTCGGNKDDVIAAIRKLPDDQPLPARPYGIEGYCPICAAANDEEDMPLNQISAFHDSKDKSDTTETMLWKNSGKFFKQVTAFDAQRIKDAIETWKKENGNLPYPKSEVPDGAETHRLLEHHYRFWNQMFTGRQLLALSTLLKCIEDEPNESLREMLLLTFSHTLEANNVFTRTLSKRNTPGGTPPGGIFSRHDYQPKATFGEQNVFGTVSGQKTFKNCWQKVLDGKEFNLHTFDRNILDNKQIDIPNAEVVNPTASEVLLLSQSSQSIEYGERIDFVITDPPYAGNVNYSELADFFYVWLRLPLARKYSHFAPEVTPKVEEVIENRSRGKSPQDFKNGLRSVFQESNRLMEDNGLLIFTFHHAEGSAWESLLEAVCESGFYVEAVYPIHGEAENSLHLMDKEGAISYDLVHICRKQSAESKGSKRSWAGVRNEIRRQAREEAALIRTGRYGRQELSAPDTNILLIGKCLELYSKHYGNIVDHEDKSVPISRALEEIKMLVDQIVAKEDPLPSELSDIDIPSYIYFTSLYRLKEIKSDDVSKSTRGLIETSELRERGLIIKGREKRGRTFEVKQPSERVEELKRKFHLEWPTEQLTLFLDEGQPILPKDFLFVDCVHLLLGLAEAGENVLPWLEKFRGMRPQLRAALEYLAQRNPSFEQPAKTVLGLMDERTLALSSMKSEG